MIIVLWLCSLVVVGKTFNPCEGLAQLDDSCQYDADCAGVGVHCLREKCDCVQDYSRVTAADKSVSCSKLPNTENARCTDSCAPPLTCQRNKCKCLARGTTDKNDNGECVSDRAFNATCDDHGDCNRPFMACVSKRCSCIRGSVRDSRGNCVAKPNCPFGGTVGKECTASSGKRHDYENALNTKTNEYSLDDCGEGELCFTTDDSATGHCCKATCPLDTPPVAHDCTNCDSEKNYCHIVSGNTFAYSICCPRPCSQNGYETLYADLQCMQPAALGDKCSNNAQCSQGVGMACIGGTCKCNPGYTSKKDTRVPSVFNEPQSCERVCNSSNWVRDGQCFGTSDVLRQCFVQEQCPTNAGCYRGSCLCKCGYDNVGGSCKVIIPASTAAPATTKNPLGALSGLLSGSGGSNTALSGLLGGSGGSSPLSGLLTGAGTSGSGGLSSLLGGLGGQGGSTNLLTSLSGLLKGNGK